MGKVHREIMFAVALYYAHRGLQYTCAVVDRKIVPVRTDHKWDKQADLERIASVCDKHGYRRFTSTAGTFFFQRHDGRTFKVDEKIFPDATPVKKEKRKSRREMVLAIMGKDK